VREGLARKFLRTRSYDFFFPTSFFPPFLGFLDEFLSWTVLLSCKFSSFASFLELNGKEILTPIPFPPFPPPPLPPLFFLHPCRARQALTPSAVCAGCFPVPCCAILSARRGHPRREMIFLAFLFFFPLSSFFFAGPFGPVMSVVTNQASLRRVLGSLPCWLFRMSRPDPARPIYISSSVFFSFLYPSFPADGVLLLPRIDPLDRVHRRTAFSLPCQSLPSAPPILQKQEHSAVRVKSFFPSPLPPFFFSPRFFRPRCWRALN